LSDSKGASAALSSEVAVMSVHRSMRGFVGPADIFRNPEAIFRKFKPTTPKMTAEGNSPFRLVSEMRMRSHSACCFMAPKELSLTYVCRSCFICCPQVLTHSGLDWAVMGMHFKLGLYEHQSAGALQGVIDIFRKNPSLLSSKLKTIKIIAYQPAFGIIGDPSKRRPETRQSADHSMVYIIATLIKKARSVAAAAAGGALAADQIGLWSSLMLLPIDYSRTSIRDADTQALMKLIEFEHGGPSYDEKYPEGIPTSVVITTEAGESHDSGMVLFPAGHARYQGPWTDIEQILKHKFETLAALAVAVRHRHIHIFSCAVASVSMHVKTQSSVAFDVLLCVCGGCVRRMFRLR
jgi:2-methylcitrate dehydratase